MSDMDPQPVESLKALDPNRPIREADIGRTIQFCFGARDSAIVVSAMS